MTADRFLVDTSLLIDHLRADRRALQYVQQLLTSDTFVAASVVSKTEIRAGMRDGEEAKTQALLDLFDWLPIDDEIAERAGDLLRRYRRSFVGIDLIDYFIAATAQCVNMTLVTLNAHHFPMLENVVTPY